MVTGYLKPQSMVETKFHGTHTVSKDKCFFPNREIMSD